MAAEKTYYAATDLTIERLSIKRGDVLGTGNVPAAGVHPGGTFKAVKGLELIDAGHIQAGVETGRIVTEKPAPLPPPRKSARPETPPPAPSPDQAPAQAQTKPEPENKSGTSGKSGSASPGSSGGGKGSK
jgi:hypothetical protein